MRAGRGHHESRLSENALLLKMATSSADTIRINFPFSNRSVQRSIGRRLVLRTSVCVRMGLIACALLPGFPGSSTAQEAQVSFPAAPLKTSGATPLFSVDIVESPKGTTVALPSVTVVETPRGPRMSNLALKLPLLSIGGTSVASQLGDQALPRTFSSSPWAGDLVKRPIRGLSLSTTGTTPVNFMVGQVDGSRPVTQSGYAPGMIALSMGVGSKQELSVTPRALVPVGSKTTQASVGTAIRTEVSQHVSVVSDLGAAGTTQQGWDPLASAAIIGHWSGAEFETNLLRGGTPLDTGIAAVRSLDREIVRGQVRSIPGMTVSTQASWSRPASAPTSADTTVGSIGVAYARLPIGVLTAARQDEDSPAQQVDTTRIGWRRKPVGGIVVRYIQRAQTPRDRLLPGVVSKQVELDVPGWIDRDLRNRLDVGAVLTENPGPDMPTVSSKLSGRFDVVGDVGVTGETEVGFTRGGPTLRELRLASSVPLLDRTAVQLVYVYQARGPYVFENQSFEARVSRSLPLANW
jgi:hypothetical protein